MGAAASRRAPTAGRRAKRINAAWGEPQMSKRIWTSVAVAALVVAGVMYLAAPGQRAEAQSAGALVNAVDLDIAPDQMDAYMAAIKENGSASVTEPGCRMFNITVQADKPNHVFLFEVYDSETALKAHRETDHFKKYAATTSKMVTGRNVRPLTAVAFNIKAK
jgi:quinol monooxygenase YgiN